MALGFRQTNRNYKRVSGQSLALSETSLLRRYAFPLAVAAGLLISFTLLIVAIQTSWFKQDDPYALTLSELSQNAGPAAQSSDDATVVDSMITRDVDHLNSQLNNALIAEAQLETETTNNELSFAYNQRPNTINIPSVIATFEANELPWQTITIESGDTLSGLFARLDLPQASWLNILALGGETDQFTRLRAGKTIDMAWVENGDSKDLLGIRLQYSESHTLEVINKGDYYEPYNLYHPPEIREVFAHGAINSSLSVDAEAAGVPMSVVMKMADIFAWDIDFAMDIRQGDTFSVVYEEVWANGEMVRTGKVLATKFENRGRVKEAVYFQSDDGYAGHFTPDGSSLRKAFLRSPLKFSRISSKFNLARRHPVLNTIRAHRGVDYAAKTGTPINAAGDGKVSFAGWKSGYGRTLVIKHHGGIETLYAHLNGFAKDIKVGQRVTQGQLVAYVGSSGLATGPHLHYEFRQNGQHKDPLKVTLPRSIPLPTEYAADFNIASKRLMTRLNQLGGQPSLQENTAPIAD